MTLGTNDFRGHDKPISWYDNTRTARQYIGYIAELNGGYARIDNGILYFYKQNTPSMKTISIDDCADFKIGEKHKITRVVYELGALKHEYGDQTGNTLYLNGENVFITEQREVEEIYNEIKDFEFYSFTTTNCPIDFDLKVGDIITFDDSVNIYPTIVSYDLEYYGGWNGGYSLNVNTEKQEETKLVGNAQKIKDLTIKVDRESNKITQAIQEIDNQNKKISSVEQTVNELNLKIGDIADITTSQESINGIVSFTQINQSEPIYVKIYPIDDNISYLYPHDNLYPSDALYLKNRVLRFTNTTTEEVFDYELPDDLLITAGGYDEFILDYDAQTCLVNKRCGYNADGTTYLLENSQTIEYEYPRILLTDGDYTVEVLGYPNAYLFVRLMAQNIYTTQFATKAEVNSEILQTTQSMDLSVNKKLENYSTTTEMNSAINMKANEINMEVGKKVNNEDFTSANILLKINNDESEAQINADKININGTVSANGNFKVDTNGNMECNNGIFKGGKITLKGGTQYNTNFEVSTESGNDRIAITPTNVYVDSDEGGVYINGLSNSYQQRAYLYTDDGDEPNLYLYAINKGTTRIKSSGITTPAVTQTSLESLKKNFEKIENATM